MKLDKYFTISLLLIITITAYCTTAFSGQGTITGQVLDGFDKAVKDVEITIKGTKFAAKSDETGQFQIKFKPGKIALSFRKKGYAKQNIPLTMHDASPVHLQQLALWKYPESGGAFLVRVEDYKKLEYASFYSERDENSISFYVKGEPTKIECPGDAFEKGKIWLMVLDYSKDEPIVVGKNLYKVTDNNLIGNIVFKAGNWGVEKIEDKYSEVSNRVGLRYVTLGPGKYYYCIGQLTQKSKLGFGYYFEIVDPTQ